MPYSFMHTGDEHIDNDTHGSINTVTGLNTAWESNYRTIRFLADTAVARGADFFISAGDNFKTGRPTQEALLLFVEALTPLAQAGIPIVLLDGNHHRTGVSADHRTVIHVVAQMLSARGGVVHIASEPGLIRLPGGHQIAALPWLNSRKILNQLGHVGLAPAAADQAVADYAHGLLESMAAQADPGAPLIMASHVTVDDLRIDAVADGFTRGSEMDLAHLFSEPVLSRRRLETLPYHYGALSHIHTPQRMADRYYYAGSPNRLTFTDMPDVKGGNFVTVADSAALTVEKVETPARVMRQIDLDAEDVDTQFNAVIPEALVRVLLKTGDPELPRSVRQRIQKAGAFLVETKARPRPREEHKRVALPEQVDQLTALKTWFQHNTIAGVTADQLVSAAEKLEAAS